MLSVISMNQVYKYYVQVKFVCPSARDLISVRKLLGKFLKHFVVVNFRLSAIFVHNKV
jgi:hypothetical protein